MSGPGPTPCLEEARIAVSCPACEEKYLIQSSRALQQGGSFLCKICRARVNLPSRDPAGTITPVPADADVPGTPPPAPDPAETELADPADSAVPSRIHDAAGEELLGFDDIMPSLGVRDERFERDEPPPRARAAKPTLVECPHCGNTFVPAAKGAGASRPAHGVKAPEELKTVLIVEDTEFFLEYAKDALSPHYRPLTARTAAEALSLLRAEPVKLVILDLGLQGDSDGLEVLAATAARRLPCIIFTARQESDLMGSAWEGLRAKGASDLLIKGMNVEEQLLGKVAELLGEGLPDRD